MEAVRRYLYGAAGAGSYVDATTLVTKVPSFLYETEWPWPYDVEHANEMDYLFELDGRARWQSAPKAEWQQLVKSRLARALKELEPRHGGTRGGVWYVYVVVWDETESRRRQGRGGLGSRYNNPFNVYSSPLERETLINHTR